MRSTLIEKLCCPFDKNDLNLHVVTQDISGDIKEGILTCSFCKRYFPIIYGIPIMNPDEYREELLESPILAQWNDKLAVSIGSGFKLLENKNNNT